MGACTSSAHLPFAYFRSPTSTQNPLCFSSAMRPYLGQTIFESGGFHSARCARNASATCKGLAPDYMYPSNTKTPNGFGFDGSYRTFTSNSSIPK